MAKTKSRQYYAYPVSGQRRATIGSPWVPYSSPGDDTAETEDTISHGFSNGRWTGGGDWSLSRYSSDWYPKPLKINSTLVEGTIRLEGPTSGAPLLPLPAHPTGFELLAMGATAIARTEPTSPVFDLATNIGEIRADGIPNLPGHTAMETTRLAKKAGGEYLNVEFGWLPLVRAVRDFAATVDKSDKIIREFTQRANKPIRRSYEWPSEEANSAVACTHTMTPPAGFFNGGGQSQRTWKRTWFEAEYIYYLPMGPGRAEQMQRYGKYARKLLGVDLSPEVLWNLAPWSWAADWFANTGDILHNVSAITNGGLVIRWAYVMCHSGRSVLRHGTAGSGGAKYPQTRVMVTESKSRRAASPFGFGVSFDSLSNQQLAIVAALGLSRW